MVDKIAREIPLAEITLRKYERPHNHELRELVKRLCLSIGLLQPGDSRDSIVDVFLVFLKNTKPIPAEEIVSLVRVTRKELHLPSIGMAESNLRRQVRRLKEQGWIMKYSQGYAITEHMTLTTLFKEKIQTLVIGPTISRIEEYCQIIDSAVSLK